MIGEFALGHVTILGYRTNDVSWADLLFRIDLFVF
jgi:hypothetical protein